MRIRARRTNSRRSERERDRYLRADSENQGVKLACKRVVFLGLQHEMKTPPELGVNSAGKQWVPNI
jgi:hypothetical protein